MKRLTNNEAYNYIVRSKCYIDTVDKYDKNKVTKARSGINPTTPSSDIGKVAAELGLRAYEDETVPIDPPPPPLPPPPNPPPIPPPVPPNTALLFSKKYAYVRGPNSGSETEKMHQLKLAGYGVVTLNTGDHTVGEWSAWITLAANNGLSCIPWARCFTLDDVSRLRTNAGLMNAPGLIVNLEQNSGDPRWSFSGAEVANRLGGYVGAIAVSTEPWMPDNFDWQPLIKMGAICLPQTSIWEFNVTPQMAVDRAVKTFGWAAAIPSFGTYDVNGKVPLRSDYDWSGNFGIYTVDDLAISEVAQWV